MPNTRSVDKDLYAELVLSKRCKERGLHFPCQGLERLWRAQLPVQRLLLLSLLLSFRSCAPSGTPQLRSLWVVHCAYEGAPVPNQTCWCCNAWPPSLHTRPWFGSLPSGV